MNDDYDAMNCCSEYFYVRYADEDTLIDLSMLHQQEFDNKDENSILTDENQSLKYVLLQCYESHSSLIRIILFIFIIITWSLIIIYFLNSIGLKPKFVDSNERV